MHITLETMREFAPGGKLPILKAFAENADVLIAGGINTPKRISHFMAQMAAETGGMREIEENLSYSAERLCAVWPRRFPSIASAKPFARNPRALANKVYGGRMGNTAADDGWTFRGRTPTHLTGKDNYAKGGAAIGVDLVRSPDQANEPRNMVRLAVWYWNSRNINRHADANDIRKVTYAVNGGYNGLADRRAYLRKAVAVWGEGEVDPAGKAFANTNTGRTTIGGGVGLGAFSLYTVSDYAYQASMAVDTGKSLAETLGISMTTLVIAGVAAAALAYIAYDRWFIRKYEGL